MRIRIVTVSLASMFVVLGAVSCDQAERDALNAKNAELSAELAKVKNDLTVAQAETGSLTDEVTELNTKAADVLNDLANAQTLKAQAEEAAKLCAEKLLQAEAMDALTQDQLLLDALGPELSGSYLAVKRSEYAAFAAEDLDFEIRHHIHKF